MSELRYWGVTSFDGSGLARNDAELVAPDSEVTLGRALVTRRLQLSLDPSHAAAALEVSRSTYGAYERDERRLAPDTLRALAAFLDVSLPRVLEFYGATCIAQARRALLKEPSTEPAPAARAPRTRVRRRDHGNEMAVVKRVFFDESSSSVTPEDADHELDAASSHVEAGANDASRRVRDEHAEWQLGAKSKKAKRRDRAAAPTSAKSKKKNKKKR